LIGNEPTNYLCEAGGVSAGLTVEESEELTDEESEELGDCSSLTEARTLPQKAEQRK